MKRSRAESYDSHDQSTLTTTAAVAAEEGAINNHAMIKEEVTDDRAERNRERNREHAKRTRLRKKEMIEGMKARLLDLQREAAELEQLLEESNTANILMHLSMKMANGGSVDDAAAIAAEVGEKVDSHKFVLPKGNIVDQLRHRVRAEAAQTLKRSNDHGSNTKATESITSAAAEAASAASESGQETRSASTSSEDQSSSSKVSSIQKEEETSSNANTSKASDSLDSEKSSNDNGSGREEENSHNHPPPPLSKSFSAWSKQEAERLVGEHMGDLGDGGDDEDENTDALKLAGASPETMKRERNRMHAKLTRDRKKLFTHRMQQLIQALERHNLMMRDRLGSMIHSGAAPMNVPAPLHFPRQSTVPPSAAMAAASTPIHHPGMMGVGYPAGAGYGYPGMYGYPAIPPHPSFPLAYPAAVIPPQFGGVPSRATADMYMRSIASAVNSEAPSARHIYQYLSGNNRPNDGTKDANKSD